MKEKDTTPEEGLSKVDLNSLPNKEVQGNDHKDVQRTQERIVGTEREIQGF